jgi:hypothetical protein
MPVTDHTRRPIDLRHARNQIGRQELSPDAHQKSNHVPGNINWIRDCGRLAAAIRVVARCLRPGGAFIVMTPNLLNYGIFGNAIASKVIPEQLRLRIVHASDSRAKEEIFPVCYKANTMHCLIDLLNGSGLQVHKTISLRQQQPYWRKHPSFEKVLMWLTPIYVLLVCVTPAASSRLVATFESPRSGRVARSLSESIARRRVTGPRRFAVRWLATWTWLCLGPL